MLRPCENSLAFFRTSVLCKAWLSAFFQVKKVWFLKCKCKSPIDSFHMISIYIKNYIRSKVRKIWRSWKMEAKFWSIWILRRNHLIEDWIENWLFWSYWSQPTLKPFRRAFGLYQNELGFLLDSNFSLIWQRRININNRKRSGNKIKYRENSFKTLVFSCTL